MSDAISMLHASLIRAGVNLETLTASDLQGRTDIPTELRRLDHDALLAQLRAVDDHMRKAEASVNLGLHVGGARRVGATGPGSVLQVQTDQIKATNGEGAASGDVSGDRALAGFKQLFDRMLAEGNWDQDGVTIRLSGKETPPLEAEFIRQLDALPNTAERALYRNGVADLLMTFEGNKQEKLTAGRLADKIDSLFQAKLAPEGLGLDRQMDGPAATDINLSGVKTGLQGAAVFAGVLACHMRDQKAWTISDKDGAEFAKWKGDTVRVVKAETNRLKALMDEILAVLPQGEVAAFHGLVADLLTKLQGSTYETEKKFPDLLRYLNAAFDKVR